MIKVSILIPCYNAEKWIRQCIESALNQTYSNKEIIVIDDGSTDNSLEIIKSFGNSIHWETGKNQGGNITRNRLLKLSTGEWLQYLDADDYLLPDKIANQVNCLESVIEADIICSPGIAEYYIDNKIWQEQGPTLYPRDPWILLAKWNLPQTGGSLWSRQAIMDVGGWKVDQPCCQEHELYMRLLIAGKKFAFFDGSEAIYRLWNTASVSRKNQWEVYSHRLEIKDRIEKYLKSIGKLDEPRQNTINQSRFECARVIYGFDQSWALKINQKIMLTNPYFIPSGVAIPKNYQILYRIFGFKFSEEVAKVKRFFSKKFVFEASP